MIQLPAQLPFPVVSDVSELRPEKVLIYTLAGAAYNLVGYLNTYSKTGEGWSLGKAKRAIIYGFITGLIVAIMDPDASPTAASFEKWAYLAPAVLDQLASAKDNLGRQIENNQYGDMANDWFEDGRRPQQGDELSEELDRIADEGAAGELDYFDAIAPDDLPEGDPEAPSDGESESEAAGDRDADGNGNTPKGTGLHESA